MVWLPNGKNNCEDVYSGGQTLHRAAITKHTKIKEIIKIYDVDKKPS